MKTSKPAATLAPIVDYISDDTCRALYRLGFQSDATGDAPGSRFVTLTDARGSFRVWAKPDTRVADGFDACDAIFRS